MALRFVVNDAVLDEFTIGEMIALDRAINAGTLGTEEARDLFARFLVDEQGQPLGDEVARARINQVKRKELPALMQQFTSAFKDWREGAVPLASGGSS